MPEKSLYFSAGFDPSITIWNSVNNNQMDKIVGHNDRIFDIAVADEGDLLASSSFDGTVRLWDLKDWRKRLLFPEFAEDIPKVFPRLWFGDSGKRFYAGSATKVVCWNLETGETSNLVFGCSIINPVKPVSATSKGKIIKLRDTLNGVELGSLDGHSKDIEYMCFSDDGRLMATFSEGDKYIVWDTDSWREIARFTHRGNDYWSFYNADFYLSNPPMRFSPDGTKIAFGNDRMGFDVLVLNSKLERTSIERTNLNENKNDWINDFAFDPSARWIASTSNKGALEVWDLEQPESGGRSLKVNSPPIRIQFSPDGKGLIAMGRDWLGIWNTQSWEATALMTGEFRELAVASNTNRFFTMNMSGGLEVRDLETGNKIIEISVMLGPVSISKFDTLAVAGPYGFVKILDGSPIIRKESSR